MAESPRARKKRLAWHRAYYAQRKKNDPAWVEHRRKVSREHKMRKKLEGAAT